MKIPLLFLLLCLLCSSVCGRCRISKRTRRCIEEVNITEVFLLLRHTYKKSENYTNFDQELLKDSKMISPDWVTKDLFTKALRSFFKSDDVTILGYTSTAAVQAGDNYTSNIFRTVVTYNLEKCQTNDSISLIVKCAPIEKEQMLQFIKEIQLFKKELEVYKNTLPALYEILDKRHTLSAKFIYYTDEPHEVIIFEDLSKTGFKMHNRLHGLDLEHCFMVVEKIASLHAASVVLYEIKPELFSTFSKGLFSENAMIVAWIEKCFESLINSCNTWNGFQKYASKLKLIFDKVPDRAAAVTARRLGGFNVLNHGDAWLNNILFSYDEGGKLLDSKFVDFQLVVFSTPVIDLHYFWATSPSIEVKRNHLDSVLERYYSKLIYTLSKLNYSLERVPSKKQIYKDWESKAFYGLLASAAILPFVKASSREDSSFDDFMAKEDADSFRHHAFTNERYKKHMEYLLPFFDNMGAMDNY